MGFRNEKMKFDEIKIGMLAVFAGFSLGCAGYHVGTTNGRIAGGVKPDLHAFVAKARHFNKTGNAPTP